MASSSLGQPGAEALPRWIPPLFPLLHNSVRTRGLALSFDLEQACDPVWLDSRHAENAQAAANAEARIHHWARGLALAFGGPVAGKARLPSRRPSLSGPLNALDLTMAAALMLDDAREHLDGTCAAARLVTTWRMVAGERYELAMSASALHLQTPLRDGAAERCMEAAQRCFDGMGGSWLKVLSEVWPPIALGSGLEKFSATWIVDFEGGRQDDPLPLGTWPAGAWPAPRLLGRLPVLGIPVVTVDHQDEDDDEHDKQRPVRSYDVELI